jgi:hypothetical protein
MRRVRFMTSPPKLPSKSSRTLALRPMRNSLSTDPSQSGFGSPSLRLTALLHEPPESASRAAVAAGSVVLGRGRPSESRSSAPVSQFRAEYAPKKIPAGCPSSIRFG